MAFAGRHSSAATPGNVFILHPEGHMPSSLFTEFQTGRGELWKSWFQLSQHFSLRSLSLGLSFPSCTRTTLLSLSNSLDLRRARTVDDGS